MSRARSVAVVTVIPPRKIQIATSKRIKDDWMLDTMDSQIDDIKHKIRAAKLIKYIGNCLLERCNGDS